MNGTIGWALAAIATALAYMQYGWYGVALAVSVMVFWLLLQFTRALRVMRTAAQAPVGRVPSAVMMQAKMRKGMRLMDIILLTRSLGLKIADDPETYSWSDESGASVTVQLRGGRVSEWQFARTAGDSVAPEAGA